MSQTLDHRGPVSYFLHLHKQVTRLLNDSHMNQQWINRIVKCDVFLWLLDPFINVLKPHILSHLVNIDASAINYFEKTSLN